jgi:hypothetical protein
MNVFELLDHAGVAAHPARRLDGDARAPSSIASLVGVATRRIARTLE